MTQIEQDVAVAGLHARVRLVAGALAVTLSGVETIDGLRGVVQALPEVLGGRGVRAMLFDHRAAEIRVTAAELNTLVAGVDRKRPIAQPAICLCRPIDRMAFDLHSSYAAAQDAPRVVVTDAGQAFVLLAAMSAQAEPLFHRAAKRGGRRTSADSADTLETSAFGQL